MIGAGAVIGAVELVLVAGDRSTRSDHKAQSGTGNDRLGVCCLSEVITSALALCRSYK